MGNEFKGTKGNWYVCQNTGGFDIHSKREIAGLDVIAKIKNQFHKDATKANAKLISKAPCMLNMLKELYEFYETLAMKINSDDFDEDFRAKWNPIMTKSEQLIKEATTI